MAYDASPPIISKYTRQEMVDSRPRTPGASRVTDDLEESSLAAWWNIDKTINLNDNTTPFRKQRYEPIKWANAHLLLEEDGAEFLADDPFATPAPVMKSAKKLSSARKRNGNAAAGYPRSSSLALVGSHRDLTLADLTPRSRRLSGFRAKTPQRSRTSEPNIRPLGFAFNGPPFAPNPHHGLEVIHEHNYRQMASPSLPVFRPLTPERLPASQQSAATPQRTHRRQSDASPIKAVASMCTPTRKSRPSETQTSVESPKQKRKSGRPSIPSTELSQPTQALAREESGSDDEDLHKSIPGAFDFIASERFQPKLPKTVQEPKLPRRSNTVDVAKPLSSSRPAESTMKRAFTEPGPSNSGLTGILAEYGNSLMGLLGPNSTLPTATQTAASLKLSELSPRKPAATRQSNANEATKTISKAITRKATVSRKPDVPSPTKTKPISKAPNVAPPSRLQQPVQTQFCGNPASVRPTNMAQPAGVSVTERLTAQPTTFEVVERASSPQFNVGSGPRSRSHSRPPSRVHKDLPIQLSGPTTSVAPRNITKEAVKVAGQPSTSARTPNIVMRISPMPSPQRTLVYRSPATRALPVESRPSTLRTMAVAPVAVVVELPKPSHRALKPILKKRSLEVSPAKVGLGERAKKRQKLAEVSIREKTREKELTIYVDRGKADGERGRTAVARRGKLEQAPRKQVARSRSRAASEVPVLVLSNIGAGSPSVHRHLSRSPEIEDQDRSQSRLGQRIRNLQDDVMMYTAARGLEEDVFGTVMENSLEVVRGAMPRYSPPPQRHVLESVSPVQRPQQQHISVAQPRPERRRAAYDNQSTRSTIHVLQSSTTYNSPRRTRPPATATQKATSPVRIDYRPQVVGYFPEDPFVPRPQHHDGDDAGDCRLTIPVSPKFMRGQREREREERLLERERERQRQRPMKPIVQPKGRSTRVVQRDMPPVAAALLAKLAGFEADLTSRQTRNKPALPASHKFTFRSDLRPALGKEGAVLADRAIKQQFESTRNLWEQRSLEASLESRADSLNRSRSRSRGASAQQTRPVGRYALPTAATSARAAAREARRDVRRREGGVQRDERGDRAERLSAWNRPSGARDNRPW